mmetsp:Transcript_51606/g.85587  ORF Transcript_51606/g.85587 Transcript_51606/m.85587 type:complete len:291 (+) Transcript_51606:102-974(+)|eukprot:CAMPEP_0119342432 /NCGR_PEP_ID=MMETSP1333-20130426/104697_1 /TAXON_ID=418940 /ORGANISM="Scyphosphaera apsteinii, Strain RCC1455" /LENGTH=290 /DNA_ID=CAMNT_0007354649 /DNA_START=101 /DNA_END=973 /DNA_ORIENTATION=-
MERNLAFYAAAAGGMLLILWCWTLRLTGSRRHTKAWRHPVLYVGPDNEIKDVLPLHPGGGEYVRIVTVSDTHTQEGLLKVPPGDILIHAGDALFKNLDANNTTSIQRVSAWLAQQCCRQQILIGGNHEMLLDELGASESKKAFSGYIEDELLEFEGLRIYGTPLSRPYKHGGESEDGDILGVNKAFQTNTFARVAKIPTANIDVLITHGAPHGILDEINGNHVGCPVLMRKVQELRPRLHIFGHVHHQGAKRVLVNQGTVYVNACNLDDFAPKDGGNLYPPVVIDIAKAK